MLTSDLLKRTADLALEFLDRPAGAAGRRRPFRSTSCGPPSAGPLPERGEDPLADDRAPRRAADPGLVGHGRGRATSASSSAATCRPRWPPTG